FKVHDKSDDEIFIIKIAWQTLVKDAIPTIKKGMTILYKQVLDEIKLYVNNSKGPAKELKLDDMISKHFNIDYIEEGLILIYSQ
ncbi:15676_t:CDS:1, partial [Funneliformis mosseae]